MSSTIHKQPLTAVAADNATAYSESVKTPKSTGEMAVLLTTSAGQITVSQQVSTNNKDWYDPIDEDGTALGAVATNFTSTTAKWIDFTPVMAPYTRFKVTENNVAAATVNITLIFEEEAR